MLNLFADEELICEENKEFSLAIDMQIVNYLLLQLTIILR